MRLDSVRIGLPVRVSPKDDSDPRVGAAHKIYEFVADLVTQNGAEAVRIAPTNELDALLESCDGFVLPGGGDIDPALYGGRSDEISLFGVDAEQDVFDIRVTRFALEKRRPILGLCRGMQLLNVVEGGSLVMDLNPTSVSHLARVVRGDETVVHEVALCSNTLVGEMHENRVLLPVRSSHHQAVDRLGMGLRVSARTSDDCVEAIESVDPERWTVGIQWHPEVAVEGDPARHAPFAALRAAAERARDCRRSHAERIRAGL